VEKSLIALRSIILTIREEERSTGTVWRSRESDDLSGLRWYPARPL